MAFAQAVTELGVAGMDRLILLGAGEAVCIGTAAELRAVATILDCVTDQPMGAPGADIGPAIRAWQHLYVRGLASSLVCAALFRRWGLCSCGRCQGGGGR